VPEYTPSNQEYLKQIKEKYYAQKYLDKNNLYIYWALSLIPVIETK